jgi:hypothetical protein
VFYRELGEGASWGALGFPVASSTVTNSHQARHLRIPPDDFGIQRLKLYRYR